jgi:two-component system NtrC family sensor kinase
MNSYLSSILSAIEKAEHLADDERNELINAIKKVDKELTIVEFKLERTEKVKRTTSILLEETISELEEKRKAVEETNAALQKSMQELKSTQAQLIQSEKMASLGELTAGIAHEIQNPLNFVNNFSEVSEEMIQEIKEERLKTKDQRDEALEDEILSDIEQNLQKIQHHGHRASSIVKGMLEHSRTSSGEKELTDMNSLTDEYLKLSYQSLRAKDKTFDAELVTDYDSELPMIEVIPQDIGRVLLNLINNAFQATSDEALKRKLNSSEYEAKLDSYKPMVSITTTQKPKADGQKQIAISIKDNGPGIPDEIKDKIFQPFFTTKDTGKGTGLGLSLAYDIVKAHGGELKVESEEGSGSVFIIVLDA